MEDDRDAEDAIRKLHDREFGYKRRPLKVQWAKQAEADRKKAVEPSATIFVVNFDVQRVTERDLLAHFDYYGPIRRIEIRKNYAFIQYDSIKVGAARCQVVQSYLNFVNQCLSCCLWLESRGYVMGKLAVTKSAPMQDGLHSCWTCSQKPTTSRVVAVADAGCSSRA
eukprot:351612-Chlamydomonas_euryale.AAC.12